MGDNTLFFNALGDFVAVRERFRPRPAGDRPRAPGANPAVATGPSAMLIEELPCPREM